MIDNSILTPLYIQAILEENEDVRNAIGADYKKKIFPLQQPQDIKFPFIVYQRNSITPQYNKDYMGWTNMVQFEIGCVSNNYIQSLNIANAVRHAVEWYRWKDKDINITRINVDSINESIINADTGDVFVQSIFISFHCEPVQNTNT